MDDLAAGRMLRLLRLRRALRLKDLAGPSRLSPSTLARHERGVLSSVGSLRRHGAALGVRTELVLVGRGADLPRLRDDEHAAIVNLLARRYASAGWRTEAEASFSEWGERGRIDLFAARGGTSPRLHVVEVKADLSDLQDLFGSLNVKRRLAPVVARRLGWPTGDVSVALAVASTAHNRAIVRRHATLFAAFAPRTLGKGNAVESWSGRVLLWVPASVARRGSWLAGRRRVRSETARRSRGG